MTLLTTSRHVIDGLPRKAHANRLDIDRTTGTLFAELFEVYLKASDGVKEVIVSMVKILNDADADAEERNAALDTLVEVLFSPKEGKDFGTDLEEFEDATAEEAKLIAESITHQQTFFANAVRKLMKSQKITQKALANKIGIGQTAVSMILSRECRPQQETIKKFAKALNVDPKRLWPL